MFRGKGGLARKSAGIVLAVAGFAIIADKVPFVVWWIGLGFGLIGLGWKLFTG